MKKKMSTKQEDLIGEYMKNIDVNGEEKIYIRTIKSFLNAFLTTYGIKTGLSLGLHLVSLAKKNPKHLLSINKIFKNDLFVKSVRWALFVSIFAGAFEGISK